MPEKLAVVSTFRGTSSETTVLIISQSTLEIDAKKIREMEEVYCGSGKMER
ncbi:MAG: hypothetical protein ACLVHV_16120 [Oscillospiraceae bacterium]